MTVKGVKIRVIEMKSMKDLEFFHLYSSRIKVCRKYGFNYDYFKTKKFPFKYKGFFFDRHWVNPEVELE